MATLASRIYIKLNKFMYCCVRAVLQYSKQGRVSRFSRDVFKSVFSNCFAV